MTPKLSLVGLYKAAPEILDLFTIPDGLDKDIAISTIMDETAELSLIDISPPSLKWRIGIWSKGQLWKWTELYNTMLYDYNPIHNYDRTENEALKETRKLTWKNNAQESMAQNIGDVEDVESATSKAGYNTGEMVLSDSTKDNNTRYRRSESGAVTNQENKNTGTVKHDNSKRMYGNIGVTSTQELIKQQREVVDFNIYKIIAEDFKEKFCIMLY